MKLCHNDPIRKSKVNKTGLRQTDRQEVLGIQILFYINLDKQN